MQTHSSITISRILFVLACAGAAAPALATEHVVLESNAPRYAAGDILADDAAIVLESGQTVVLAAENGDLIRVEGPFSGRPQGSTPAGIDLRQAVRQLVGGSETELAGLGGVRGRADSADAAHVEDMRPSPWLIHAELTGSQCYVEDRPTEIWRNETGDGAEFEIREVATSRTATIRWPAGSHETRWPADLPPRSGEVYLVRRTDQLRSGTSIKVYSLEPGAADNGYAAAAWLAARGCTDQARLALAKLD
jgi:hypothetical protein